ncbi:MAG: Grx4 family monothiol glutaredoxin [bacterium]
MTDTMESIQQTVDENDVVIFMKGDANQPMCGFSEAAVEVIESYGVDFETRDVLKDPELRNAIKEFSDWPTIPQVYINGEFVGGSDIVREMHMKGELETLIEDVEEKPEES